MKSWLHARKHLDQVCDIDWHLFDLCIAKLLNVQQCALIFLGHKIDGDTLTSEATTATNSEMEIV
jgi:hypothetical protein